MKNHRYLAAGALTLIGVIGFMFFIGTALNGLSQCGEEKTKIIWSPNRKTVALSSVRNCGATTDYATHIDIYDASELMTSDKINFNRANEIAVIEGSQDVQVIWISENELQLSIPENSRIFRRMSNYKGITLSYQ